MQVIQRLNRKDIEKSRSSVVISSMTHCILELIKNSIDASAKNIRVQFNTHNGSIIIEDDGCGISYASFGLIGQKYGMIFLLDRLIVSYVETTR
jgi:DNA mismatch repair ATPase MutL